MSWNPFKRVESKPFEETFLTILRDAIGIPKSVEWMDTDAAALREFFKTSTGARLRNYLLGQSVAFNEFATNQKKDSAERGCGQAQGFKTAYALLLSLAEAQISNPETSADTNGTADALAHLRP